MFTLYLHTLIICVLLNIMFNVMSDNKIVIIRCVVVVISYMYMLNKDVLTLNVDSFLLFIAISAHLFDEFHLGPNYH